MKLSQFKIRTKENHYIIDLISNNQITTCLLFDILPKVIDVAHSFDSVLVEMVAALPFELVRKVAADAVQSLEEFLTVGAVVLPYENN